ncbi:MAG TPA: ABC transporter ATP-binding protein [Gemmatimonadaceae bacterium]
MSSLETTSTTPIIIARGVSKTYPTPAGTFSALNDVDFSANAGELTLIIGQSGSGKSTLLGLLGGIDRATNGEIHVGSTAVHTLSENALSVWRGRAVGVVFQFFQLLPTLTAVENVMLPMDFCNAWPARERRDRARALLDRLGVLDQADKLPSKLSGGQQQRVAIARALANAPRVLLADEPTGNLDSRTSQHLLELFASLASDGQTIVMVTHDRSAQQYASHTVTLVDGRVATNEVAAYA